VNQNEFASALNEAIMRVFTRHGLNTEKLYWPIHHRGKYNQ
jgi:hypothetical protein